MTAIDEAPRLLSLPEAARRLAISVRSLRTLVALGKMAVIRVTRRRVVIDERDLSAYIASRRVPAQR